MVRKIKIICVGKIKEQSIKTMCDEFTKRIKPFCNIEVIELKDKGIIEDTKNIKNKIIEDRLKNIFVMDELGKENTSIEFSKLINNTEEEITFVIGGADGLTTDIKKENKTLCLSKMTLTHEMARMLLIEQIYRSMMILNNKPYHK